MQVTIVQNFVRAEKGEKSQQQIMFECFLCISSMIRNLQILIHLILLPALGDKLLSPFYT